MQITVTFDSLEEFLQHMNPTPAMMAAAMTEEPEPAETPAEPEEKRRRGRPKKTEAPAPAEPEAEEIPWQAPAPAEPENKEVSLTDVRVVALKLSKAGKQTELKAVFEKFGAKKLSDISKENYPALMEELGKING